MKLKSVIVSLVIGVLGAAPALAMPAFDEGAAREAIRQALEPWTGEEAGPGAIIQVAHRGEPVITDMIGYADLEHAVPITADTRFHAASISKQFTAYAIVRLSSEGLVDLDASLAAYIPEAGIYRDVTVRDLLAHTHGIREWTSLIGASGFRQEDVVTNAHALDLILRQQAMNAPPGESFSYSNSGFLLLAEIVERITGLSLSDYSRELIFTPLGMDDTVFVDSLTM
ncbi:serine hydrolase domain-containing protein, partial [Leptolyngbya sp. CCNP1308]|uniref:serine hydrolase domain-containing protein n=1 Tax=Leptolyngbya sp. CCNP1308 TaxID=3110255 RepID=UPI002B1FB8AB